MCRLRLLPMWAHKTTPVVMTHSNLIVKSKTSFASEELTKICYTQSSNTYFALFPTIHNEPTLLYWMEQINGSHSDQTSANFSNNLTLNTTNKFIQKLVLKVLSLRKICCRDWPTWLVSVGRKTDTHMLMDWLNSEQVERRRNAYCGYILRFVWW